MKADSQIDQFSAVFILRKLNYLDFPDMILRIKTSLEYSYCQAIDHNCHLAIFR